MRSSRRKLIIIGIGCALIACLLLAFRSSRSGYPARITLFLTADSRGYLEPCGCRRDQAGGLSGRSTLIKAAHRDSRLVLDAGNLTSGGRAYEILKLNYMMRGMQMIGYDAVNLGKNEADLDLDALRSVLSSGLPFVSANLCVKKDGSTVTRPYLLIRRGSAVFGITGVTSTREAEAGPGLTAKPPLEALAEVIPGLRKRCDYLIVLAYEDADTIARAANQFPEIDCILGGDVPQSSGSLQEINRAVNFNVTDRGKVLGEIELKREAGVYRAEKGIGVKVMGEKLAPDPAIQQLIATYKGELRDRRFELASAEGLDRINSQDSSADEYVGSAACAACHADAHRIAALTAHSHAFQTLVNKGSEFDPECLKCHTVGYGLYSGFVDATRTPNLENVQCESCHGRGKAHVEAMRAHQQSGAPKTVTLRSVTPASCVRCHDVENSENFNYKTFWPRIAHR